jgi:hypothetical protein
MDGRGGVQVPIMSDFGGVEGERDNPYGKIAAGKRTHYAPDGSVVSEEPLIPRLETKRRMAVDPEKLLISDKPLRRRKARKEESEEASLPEAPAPTLVQFEGTFGKFKGQYSRVLVQGIFIVLVAEGGSTFSPPVGDTPLTLVFDDEKHTVCFYGIEFELPFINASVQVFVKN